MGAFLAQKQRKIEKNEHYNAENFR